MRISLFSLEISDKAGLDSRCKLLFFCFSPFYRVELLSSAESSHRLFCFFSFSNGPQIRIQHQPVALFVDWPAGHLPIKWITENRNDRIDFSPLTPRAKVGRHTGNLSATRFQRDREIRAAALLVSCRRPQTENSAGGERDVFHDTVLTSSLFVTYWITTKTGNARRRCPFLLQIWMDDTHCFGRFAWPCAFSTACRITRLQRAWLIGPLTGDAHAGTQKNENRKRKTQTARSFIHTRPQMAFWHNKLVDFSSSNVFGFCKWAQVF